MEQRISEPGDFVYNTVGRMYSPPFHRRIVPWIFAAVFLAAAPVLVFYTAGYRWNPKKEKVERNGTLIIGTRPTGARIFLNGNDKGETTPVTIQNIRPGSYNIRVQKDGYHPWEKMMDIQAERVTFANDIPLFKISEPVFAGSATSAFAEAATASALVPAPKTLHIRESPETGAFFLLDERDPGRGFLLPTGQWSIEGAQSGRIILRDGDSWLSVDIAAETPIFQRAYGDRLRPFPARNDTINLMVAHGEVWLWNPKREPELLYRHSTPIADAAWHASGNAVIIATHDTMFALHVDARGGRVRTELATFDEISAVIAQTGAILVHGIRQGIAGVWRVEI